LTTTQSFVRLPATAAEEHDDVNNMVTVRGERVNRVLMVRNVVTVWGLVYLFTPVVSDFVGPIPHGEFIGVAILIAGLARFVVYVRDERRRVWKAHGN
jgi:uncharacterized membrane protein HdeD (DUF308 family)